MKATFDPMTASCFVSGRTRVVGVFGWPVTHTLSPAMHNAVYATASLEMVYVPFSVAPERVGEAVAAVRALGLLGVNVTIPHKQAVIPFLDEMSPEAKSCGSVNTIQATADGRLVGHSTDGYGFLKSLELEADFIPKGKRVVLVGTGGAGRAMAVSLAMAGARRLTLLNRTESKRIQLAQTLESLGLKEKGVELDHADPVSKLAREALAEADLIVNATSLGMKPTDPTPIDPTRLQAGQLVYDAIYIPAETRLLIEARERGCRTLGGLGMLAYQGARAVEIWTDQWPDADLMIRALKRHLGLD